MFCERACDPRKNYESVKWVGSDEQKVPVGEATAQPQNVVEAEPESSATFAFHKLVASKRKEKA